MTIIKHDKIFRKKIFFNDKTELAIREVVKPSIKILTISRWTDAF